MAHESKTQRILAATLALVEQNCGEASTDEISKALHVMTRLGHKRLLNTLSELNLAGRITRTGRACYGKPVNTPPRDKREVMWSLLQMRRRINIVTLMEMADVSQCYAKEFLNWLTRQGLAKKQQQPGRPAIWTATGEHQPLPLNTEKAEKLRNIRLQKKDKLQQALATIGTGLNEAIELLNQEEEA